MDSSYFFSQVDIGNSRAKEFLDTLKAWTVNNRIQCYVIDKPLSDGRYKYSYDGALVVLMPKRKITFLNFGNDEDSFEEYFEDFIEDLGSISDKYRYKEALGRPRKWIEDLIHKASLNEYRNLEELDNSIKIEDPTKQRKCELIISLLTGSINDIERVRSEIPDNLLDKVKQKIVLFDGEQTRFVYQKPARSVVRIQGLSGTGKTELLLHKLKELYVEEEGPRIAFTCHNRILADSLRKRIPDFFNFMRVEQQIEWNERLWCVHAWGSRDNIDSGIYRYICAYYRINFNTWSKSMPFSKACAMAIEDIKKFGNTSKAFDYILIDESQDFPEEFFELCSLVTSKNVYIAGDIFQSIFDEKIVDAINPDYLLSKCYRTDPRTLMFAHSLGMGLFEKVKLRWLEDNEWRACGYLVERPQPTLYRLSREPLRRFEDVEDGYQSVIIEQIEGSFVKEAPATIVEIIKQIADENHTLEPDDIGVILANENNTSYAIADALEVLIAQEFGWKVNKAHESKRKEPSTLFISNRNNVKGLEFSFVICVSETLGLSRTYRNGLYMSLSRSFLQTHLVVSKPNWATNMLSIIDGLQRIKDHGYIEVTAPTEPEKALINTRFNVTEHAKSLSDFLTELFEEIEVPPLLRVNLQNSLKALYTEDFDPITVRETASLLHAALLKTPK